MIRWIADWTAWWKWGRLWPGTTWEYFRECTTRLRREGKQVYCRGWRARWGN